MMNSTRNSELQDVSERVLLLAQEHDLPPTPRIYEVLFGYVTNDDHAFRDAVENALSGPHDRREDALNLTFMTYLGNEALGEGLSRVRDLMARELAELSDKISSGMRGNATMIKTLQSSIRELAGTITKESVQSVAREISVSGKTQLNETTQLSDRLNRTQFQLTRMQRELEDLREAASTDHLTRLANRRFMDERLDQMIRNNQDFSLALIDIDHFKLVNDRFGHAVGDTVLQGLGQYLHQNLKGRDFAARIGGEEFAVFLPETGLEGATTLCQSICKGFSAIHWVNQQTREEIGTVNLSIGVTERIPSDTAESLFHRADMLLYQAKDRGRAQVVAGLDAS